MSTAWDVLGVSEDADPKTLRRAYAQAIKACRPEDDPLRFQWLTDAYEWALGEARRREREAASAGAASPESAAEAAPESLATATHASTDTGADGIPVSPEPLPELGRPLDEPPPLPEPEPEPERGFDFGAFFDQLAPRLAQGTPDDLGPWLDAHPDLYSIDLKWVLIPHVVNTLAQNVETLAPSRAKVDVLLSFFGVDARLRRHPALAPALDHIDAVLGAAVREPSAAPPAPDERAPIDILLDADTPDEEIHRLRREMTQGLLGRSRMLSIDDARLLRIILSDMPRWRILLSFAMPGRFREAERTLARFEPRFARWRAAGVALPALDVVRGMLDPRPFRPTMLQMMGLRLLLSLGITGLGTALWRGSVRQGDLAGLDGILAAAALMVAVFSSIVAIATVFQLVWDGVRLVLASVLARAQPWVERQAWDPIRWAAAVLCSALPLSGWPQSTGYSLALGFTGLALASVHRTRVLLVALFVTSGLMLVLIAMLRIEGVDPANFVRLSMALIGVAFFAHERVIEERPWKRLGTSPEGLSGLLIAGWMALVAWGVAAIT